MKLTKTEIKLINKRRKYISIKRNSEKILIYRKGSKYSKGETKISEFLKSELIDFIPEYFFKDLFNPQTRQLLYFDFYIRKFNLCIEYDGEQHYRKDKTEREKVNDFLKNAYCLKNKINFLRIKYTDFDNLENLICTAIDKIEPIAFRI